MKLYCIHPGYVTSKNDGQRHFIGFTDLAICYGLDPNDCVDGKFNKGEGLIHLYPRYEGDYERHLMERQVAKLNCGLTGGCPNPGVCINFNEGKGCC